MFTSCCRNCVSAHSWMGTYNLLMMIYMKTSMVKIEFAVISNFFSHRSSSYNTTVTLSISIFIFSIYCFIWRKSRTILLFKPSFKTINPWCWILLVIIWWKISLSFRTSKGLSKF